MTARKCERGRKVRKRGRLEALPWLALPLKSEGEYDVSIATIKKNERKQRATTIIIRLGEVTQIFK